MTIFNPVTAIFVVVSLVILSAPIIPLERTETYFTSKTLTYQLTEQRSYVDNNFCFPRLVCEVTIVSQSIKNTDTVAGHFDLNFVFDDGKKIKTATIGSQILPGEEKSLSLESPFRSFPSPKVNVIAPAKQVPNFRKVTDYVNSWMFLRHWALPF